MPSFFNLKALVAGHIEIPEIEISMELVDWMAQLIALIWLH